MRRIDFQKRNGGVAVGETVNGNQEKDKLQPVTRIRRRKESKEEERQSDISDKERELYGRQRYSLLATSFYLQLAFTHLQAITQIQRPTMQVPLLRLQCGMCYGFTGGSFSDWRLTIHVN